MINIIKAALSDMLIQNLLLFLGITLAGLIIYETRARHKRKKEETQ